MSIALPRTGWRAYLLAGIAGALVTLSFAPFHLWPLGLVGAALLNALLHGATTRTAALQGYAFGVGLFGSGASWVYVSIHVYGYAPIPLAVLLTAVFCLGLALCFAAFASLYARWLQAVPGGPIWGFAALWVLLDWIRSWLLTGFPWLYPGYAYNATALGGWAPIGGIWLVSFAALASAGWCAQALRQQRLRWLSTALVAALWMGGWALSGMNWTQPTGSPKRVALVQANVPQEIKWRPDRFWPTLALYQRLSASLWESHDAVIWPEAAVPGYYQNAAGFLQRLDDAAPRTPLITGTPWREGDKAYNSLAVVGGGTYHKQYLVPFGEYVPLERWLRGLITFFDLPMSNFSPGPPAQQPLRAAGMQLAPAICYEVVYPDQLRAFLPAADTLITVSNDAWFGRSIGPHQHLQMAQMRAREHGREMIRATGNGITALIDHRGAIKQRLPQFERGVLSASVQPRTGTTPFMVLGTWPWMALFALIALALALLRRR